MKNQILLELGLSIMMIRLIILIFRKKNIINMGHQLFIHFFIEKSELLIFIYEFIFIFF